MWLDAMLRVFVSLGVMYMFEIQRFVGSSICMKLGGQGKGWDVLN